MDNMAEFAKRLKAQREKLGLTQAQLAEKIGVSSQTISAYEKNCNGEKGKTPTLDKVISIAQTLGLSIDYLCGQDSCEKECKFETIAEVINCITKIGGKIRCYASTRIVPLDPEECFEIPLNENGDTEPVTTKEVAVLVLDNNFLAWYFRDRNKITSLFQDGIIDKDLYQTILDGELAKFSQFPIVPLPVSQRRKPVIGIDRGVDYPLD